MFLVISYQSVPGYLVMGNLRRNYIEPINYDDISKNYFLSLSARLIRQEGKLRFHWFKIIRKFKNDCKA